MHRNCYCSHFFIVGEFTNKADIIFRSREKEMALTKMANVTDVVYVGDINSHP